MRVEDGHELRTKGRNEFVFYIKIIPARDKLTMAFFLLSGDRQVIVLSDIRSVPFFGHGISKRAPRAASSENCLWMLYVKKSGDRMKYVNKQVNLIKKTVGVDVSTTSNNVRMQFHRVCKRNPISEPHRPIEYASVFVVPSLCMSVIRYTPGALSRSICPVWHFAARQRSNGVFLSTLRQSYHLVKSNFVSPKFAIRRLGDSATPMTQSPQRARYTAVCVAKDDG